MLDETTAGFDLFFSLHPLFNNHKLAFTLSV